MRIAFKECNELISLIEGCYHEAALKLNLTDSEFDILYVLSAHEEGCKQSILYKETGMTKSTANTTIKKMEREQLLYLTRGTGRNTCVFLTEKGKQLMENTIYKVIQMENEIYDSWSKEEQEVFLKLNRDFVEQLNKKIQDL